MSIRTSTISPKGIPTCASSWAQESFINETGLHLLRLNRKQAAIETLTMNVQAHPQSANAWDSLAEAHLKNGDRELAIQF